MDMNRSFATVRTAPLNENQPLPLVVTPVVPGASIDDCMDDIRAIADGYLHTVGGLLFRGFSFGEETVTSRVEHFRTFAQRFASPLLSYEYGSTPRSEVSGGVYSSTEYPAHQHIPLHNEQAYTTDWPMKIWFYSVHCAAEGGETPIADSRRVYQQMDPVIRETLEHKKLMYVRNFGNGLDVEWQSVFNTEDPAEVEAFCAQHNILCEWKEDGELRTRQVCQATAVHPVTGDKVWFNQAHLFHVSNLDEEVRETLLSIVDEEDLPRNVYYGDGTPLEAHVLQHIRDVLRQETVLFPWQEHDLLMLDNMLSAHGRRPFKNSDSVSRKVVVAMAEAHQGERFPVPSSARSLNSEFA